MDDRIAGQDVTRFKIRSDGAGNAPGDLRPDVDLGLEGILLLRDFPPSDVRLPAGALGTP